MMRYHFDTDKTREELDIMDADRQAQVEDALTREMLRRCPA